MHVVLVGLMGTGKSTVGRRVAAARELGFVDLDRAVEARAGRTVREVWDEDGEAAFRALERAELLAQLESRPDRVIATGGGVVTDPDNRRDLGRADATVVWLSAPPDALAERLGPTGRASRPLLDDDPVAALRTVDAARRDLYAEVADVVVDATADLERVVERVLATLDH